ncbi:hypothetical protein L1887_14501 [Cichorium endivia]|nr:hypothetical protein L1887_14501 [Cichorium endivia]
MCPLCNSNIESEFHLFVESPKVSDVRVLLNQWWSDIPGRANSISKITSPVNFANNKVLNGVTVVLIALVWQYRNDRVFNSKNRSNFDLACEIKRVAFSWIKIRAKNGRRVDWSLWCFDPKVVCLNFLYF